MGVLIKIRSSTLVEVITASVIIVVIFAIASLTLTNVFKTTLQEDITSIKNQINYLEYKIKNKKQKLPFSQSHQNWEIVMSLEKNDNLVVIRAKNKKTNKEILKKISYENN